MVRYSDWVSDGRLTVIGGVFDLIGAYGGLVVALARGIPSRRQLALVCRSLRQGLATWLHWPLENIVERVTEDRVRRYRWQWRLAAGVVLLRVGWRFLRMFSALVRFDALARVIGQ